ncbi:hypothetical protein JL722_8844 [Aureococcus anophagefferens]|nr:hypothetical protein JL722_8844 [Aureococcus anophagefferens]
MCYRVIRDAKRRAGAGKPRAEDDECPAYYGVDYKEESAKSVCKFTERFYGIDDRGRYQGKVAALAVVPGSGSGSSGLIVFGLYDSKVEVSIQEKHRISEVVVARIEEYNVARAEAEKPLPPLHVAGASRRLERYKADFALQLKDLAYVEAADEAYLRDQAAALAPPEPMPDGSRPPIDAHSRRTAASTAAVANYRDPCGLLEPLAAARQPRRVAKLYVVPNCEVVSPPPPPIYHVTENGERPRAQAAEFLSLFDESEVEMAAAMFDSRPIEIARPLLFESEEDAERRAEPPRRSASASRRRRRRRRRRGAGDEAAPAADGAAEPAAAPEAPAEAPAASPPTAPPVEAPAEAPAPAAAPAKKKKKKRSSPTRATLVVRARTRVFRVRAFDARPQAQS